MTIFDYILIVIWTLLAIALPFTLTGAGLTQMEKFLIAEGLAKPMLPRMYYLLIIIPLIISYRIWG